MPAVEISKSVSQTNDRLYGTWLAARNRYRWIDPGGYSLQIPESHQETTVAGQDLRAPAERVGPATRASWREPDSALRGAK
jgi:hypothetical protein